MSNKYKNGLKRLLKIDELLRSRKKSGGISVREIAKIMNVSVRTVQRDLLYLQTEFDAPVTEEKHRYFYWFSWSLTDIAYTSEDMSVLALANSVLSSLFMGTSLGRMMTERLQGILEHCARMELIENKFCREEIQVAFPCGVSWKGSEKLLDAILNRKCVVVKKSGFKSDANAGIDVSPLPSVKNNSDFSAISDASGDSCVTDSEIVIRPLRVIFAWDSCYVLYIASDYKTNKDFRIDFSSALDFVREASKEEAQTVPDILKEVNIFAGLNMSLSRICDEILEIRFEGKADSYILQYERNDDGSLRFLENELTKNSGHFWEFLEKELEKQDKDRGTDWDILG